MRGGRREVPERGAQGEGGEDRGPVVQLAAARGDAVDRQRPLAAVPLPEDDREHHGPQERRAGVGDADLQVHRVGHAGAENRDRQRQEPVGRGDVAAGAQLHPQGDDEDEGLDHPGQEVPVQGEVVRCRLATGRGQQLDHPEQRGDLRGHLGPEGHSGPEGFAGPDGLPAGAAAVSAHEAVLSGAMRQGRRGLPASADRLMARPGYLLAHRWWLLPGIPAGGRNGAACMIIWSRPHHLVPGRRR